MLEASVCRSLSSEGWPIPFGFMSVFLPKLEFLKEMSHKFLLEHTCDFLMPLLIA